MQNLSSVVCLTLRCIFILIVLLILVLILIHFILILILLITIELLLSIRQPYRVKLQYNLL